MGDLSELLLEFEETEGMIGGVVSFGCWFEGRWGVGVGQCSLDEDRFASDWYYTVGLI